MNIVSEIEKQISKIKGNTTEIIDYLSKQNRSDLVDKIVKQKSVKLFDLKVKSLKDLKMAVIMDGFTLESYRPECQLLELVPDNWKQQIEDFRPHLLFIESAWKGKDDLWYRKIDRRSQEVYELTEYCHENNIPVVFWNKEDPIYTTSFMTTASLADVVFTTDIDCIQRYKAELGHDRVYHLHFAAQPAIHNPIEKYERKDKFCFAGAYYHKYKKRAEVFDKFSEVFIKTKGFDIYDRNYQNARPEHAFPELYNPYILGTLPSSQIDVAYKGYVYGINMNSVQQSQTMFARRVFEMLASNTITIGNYSRGVKNYFGDLTICTDDEKTMEEYLNQYCKDAEKSRKYRLAGLRKVLSSHLYEDRLDYIVEKVFGISLKQSPQVVMLARCKNESQVEHAIKSYLRQSYKNKKLYIIGMSEKEAVEGCTFLTEDDAKEMLGASVAGDWYACIAPEDYYGNNYIKDLVLTKRYGNYNIVGKKSFYYYEDEEYICANREAVYKETEELLSECSVVFNEVVKDMSLWDISENGKVWMCEKQFSVDEYNYCKNCLKESCEVVDDLVIKEKGIDLNCIEAIAEQIPAEEANEIDVIVIKGDNLTKQFVSTKKVSYVDKDKKLNIVSDLEDGVHEYAFGKELYSLDDYLQDGKLQIRFKTDGFLDCICVCTFYDAEKKKIEPKFPKPNAVTEIDIPENAKWLQIGFRPKGKGTYIVSEVTIGNDIGPSKDKGCFLSRSGIMVLTNHYPSDTDLYRNMFVHKRLRSYKEAGYVLDVMRMKEGITEGYREFEGINVVEGSSDALNSILDSGQIHTVCVHFLEPAMWEILKNYLQNIKVIIWSHGADIQPWWRRQFLFTSASELEQGKVESAKRMDFWNGIFKDISKYPNLHFVFVSKYASEMVFEDYKIILPQQQYSIIHNCIDTEMFDYIEKDTEQRKKILSIRPFASAVYANDLSVKFIQELAKKPYFNELDVRIIGDGILFDEILKPLKKLKNVTIEKRFLHQDEISKLHKEYGIFLVPTRTDTQGVARDEAMSSGLVPITNNVAAIPEFVDGECGILAPEEDYLAMVEGFDRLYNNPEEFSKLSANAASRVRQQTSKEYTIDNEIALIVDNNL